MNYNTDYLSYPNFLAIHTLCRNDAMKKVVKTNTILHCKVDSAKDLAYIFYLDSQERNEYIITGKEFTYFICFEVGTKC